MAIRDKIWYDFLNSKFGDEYLILYIKKQRSIRKWFKISTVLLSAGGIFTVFKDFKIPAIITLIIIGIVQLVLLIENYIINSEKVIDDIGKLRMLYYNRTNKLEELLHNIDSMKILDDEAAESFFKLRQLANEIEELDNKVNIIKYKNLIVKANISTLNYLNTYYE